MTFHSACKFCYENFKKEYNTGIGNIQECKDYWIFYKKTNEIENSIEVDVPKEFEN